MKVAKSRSSAFLIGGKTTRLVPSRGDTSRVFFSNKKSGASAFSESLSPSGCLGPASGDIVITRACVLCIVCHQIPDSQRDLRVNKIKPFPREGRLGVDFSKFRFSLRIIKMSKCEILGY